jgi:hypothetical protein
MNLWKFDLAVTALLECSKKGLRGCKAVYILLIELCVVVRFQIMIFITSFVNLVLLMTVIVSKITGQRNQEGWGV